MSKFAYTNIAGEKCLCSCTQYEGCNMECSMYRHITGKKTNADRIRQMTDEELAHLLHTAEEHIFGGNLWDYKQWADWLKAPADLEAGK